ncbi:nucleosome assembly protein [Acrasis kona]|uniref:peptidylprolyl isomerase n=1 Tax=Acrasis kona TaxID=1008807 RepID=A0AAW2ZS01_9EUKA
MSVQYLTDDKGVQKVITQKGEGEQNPPKGALVSMHYEGRLKSNNKVFDSSREHGGHPLQFAVGEGEVIKGWDIAVLTMTKGEKATITLEPEYAYGKKGAGDDIPPNSALVFDVELIEWGEVPSKYDAAFEEATRQHPKVVVERLKVLKVLNDQHEEIQKLEEKELAEIEAKYEALYAPFYARRAEILTSSKDVTEEEVSKAVAKYPITGECLKGADEQGIPDFWLKVLKNSDFGEDLIHPHDEPALKSLINVTTTTERDPENVASISKLIITMTFKPNDYFENETLTKTLTLVDDELESAQGTTIQWKQGKNLGVKIVEKKQRKKGGAGGKQQTRIVKKEEPQETFFEFFSNLSDDQLANEEDIQEYEVRSRADLSVAEAIHEDIIPNAVNYYLDLVPKQDYDDYEGDEEEEDFEEDDE